MRGGNEDVLRDSWSCAEKLRGFLGQLIRWPGAFREIILAWISELKMPAICRIVL